MYGAMAKVFSLQSLTAEFLVHSQASPCDRKVALGQAFLPVFLFSSCHYGFTSGSCPFIYHLLYIIVAYDSVVE